MPQEMIMTTLEIQRRLRALGFDPGPLDGVRGRLTTAAVRGFQAAQGLAADGIAGPQTTARLGEVTGNAAGSAPDGPGRADGGAVLPWYAEALRLRGVREAVGTADNPLIVAWARQLKLGLRRRCDRVVRTFRGALHCGQPP
jgi:peptidoglycan hydrolase-like protein with peptidoglycan-binding domain